MNRGKPVWSIKTWAQEYPTIIERNFLGWYLVEKASLWGGFRLEVGLEVGKSRFSARSCAPTDTVLLTTATFEHSHCQSLAEYSGNNPHIPNNCHAWWLLSTKRLAHELCARSWRVIRMTTDYSSAFDLVSTTILAFSRLLEYRHH